MKYDSTALFELLRCFASLAPLGEDELIALVKSEVYSLSAHLEFPSPREKLLRFFRARLETFPDSERKRFQEK